MKTQATIMVKLDDRRKRDLKPRRKKVFSQKWALSNFHLQIKNFNLLRA